MVEANATYARPKHGWTCFFCGETFRTPDVIEDDPGWVRWACDKGLIDLDDELEELLAERESGRDRR